MKTDELSVKVLEGVQAETSDAFALVGRLAVGVAHDINNYLAAAEVALAYAERAATGDSRNDLRDVRASFEGVLRIARSLTSYARGAHPAPERIELEPLIRRLLEVFGRVIPEGVRVIMEVGSDLPAVSGVASELEQIVLNLVLNACDAMTWGGTLWLILLRGPGGHLQLEVADTGRGLPREVINSEGPTTPSTKRGRTGGGLGLGIVRSLVERHGGTVELGRAPGGGTSVRVLLPT
ncbi:hypothetical protein BH11MYX3_BH11MYX3_27620 [soil metagenome]